MQLPRFLPFPVSPVESQPALPIASDASSSLSTAAAAAAAAPVASVATAANVAATANAPAAAASANAAAPASLPGWGLADDETNEPDEGSWITEENIHNGVRHDLYVTLDGRDFCACILFSSEPRLRRVLTLLTRHFFACLFPCFIPSAASSSRRRSCRKSARCLPWPSSRPTLPCRTCCSRWVCASSRSTASP